MVHRLYGKYPEKLHIKLIPVVLTQLCLAIHTSPQQAYQSSRPKEQWRLAKRRSAITHLAGAEDVVDELEEGLVFDLVVGEEERDALALGAGHAVQQLQVLHQVAHVVRPRHQKHNKLMQR